MGTRFGGAQHIGYCSTGITFQCHERCHARDMIAMHKQLYIKNALLYCCYIDGSPVKLVGLLKDGGQAEISKAVIMGR